MVGNILDFDLKERTGIVSGEDGNRYSFAMDDWKGEQMPKKGQSVDFVPNEDKATQMYPNVNRGSSDGVSKRLIAALLAFFIGAFGAHKFYLGYTTQGIIMLLVFMFGFILLGIPSLVIGVIALIECIIYLTKSDNEFEETYVVGKKTWF